MNEGMTIAAFAARYDLGKCAVGRLSRRSEAFRRHIDDHGMIGPRAWIAALFDGSAEIAVAILSVELDGVLSEIEGMLTSPLPSRSPGAAEAKIGEVAELVRLARCLATLRATEKARDRESARRRAADRQARSVPAVSEFEFELAHPKISLLSETMRTFAAWAAAGDERARRIRLQGVDGEGGAEGGPVALADVLPFGRLDGDG